VIYEGDFFKGEFHGEGTLIYPNGVIKQINKKLTGNRKANIKPNGKEGK